MPVELSEQQQLALFDVLREAKLAVKFYTDELKAQPNPAEREVEQDLLQKIQNLESAEIVLRPLTRKVGS